MKENIITGYRLVLGQINFSPYLRIIKRAYNEGNLPPPNSSNLTNLSTKTHNNHYVVKRS